MKLRFVKFLTSRENEIEKKEEEATITYFATTQLGRGQSHRSRPPPSIPLFLPPPRPPTPHPPPPSFPSATNRESNILQLSFPSCSASLFLLHKLPKQQSMADGVPSQPTQLSYPTIACGAQLAAPLPSRWPACSPPFSLSPVSRCGLSTSSEAIGKQRPKMNYPVSFPSLPNK